MCCYGQQVTNLMQLDLSVSLFSICWVQFSPFSHVRLFTVPWAAACQASLSITNSRSLLKLRSINFAMPPNDVTLFSPSLRAFSVSYIKVFSNESVLPIRWANNWSFSFSIHPSSEYSGLILFRMDWFDLISVNGTLKSLFQHYSLKGIYVCHLSVMSCSPWCNLTTITEFKQHAKMRIKSQCPI